MKSVLIVANPDKPEALRLAEEAEAELSRRHVHVSVHTLQGEDLSGRDADMAVVFGGDGTVLGAVASLGERPPPVLAFNVGRLGYLADNPPEKLRSILDFALSGRLQASRRHMVEALVDDPEGVWRRVALNEFALVIRRHGKLLPISILVDDEELMEIRSDGIIVATPTGSTAYALAAGGPVVSPEVAALILAPVCPHQLANRSLVLDMAETVKISHSGETAVELVSDGKFCRMIDQGVVVKIHMSERMISFLSPSRGRYNVLREKLGWGWNSVNSE